MRNRFARRSAGILLTVVAAGPAVAADRPAAPPPPATRPAAAPAPGSPRAAGLAFAKAVRAGDLDAARQVSVGSAKGYETLRVLSDTWKALDAFVAALRKHVPDALADRRLDGFLEGVGLRDDLDAEAARAVEAVDGDAATLTEPVRPWPPATRPAIPPDRPNDVMPDPPGAYLDPEPMILKRVGGRWLVDVDATLAKKGLDRAEHVKEWAAARDAFAARAAEIKPGMTKDEFFGRR